MGTADAIGGRLLIYDYLDIPKVHGSLQQAWCSDEERRLAVSEGS
jgi:hypothetical protein